MGHKIVPLITPFKANRLDSEKHRHHAHTLLEDGMDFLFIAGTTGLGPALTSQEKMQMVDDLQEFPSKLILQVGSLDLEESVKLAEHAKYSHLHAIGAYPPYFFPRLSEEWIVKYYIRLSKIYPLIAYNFPLATGYDLTPGVIKKVNQAGGNVIGIKDTIPDLGHMLSFKYELGNDFLVYSGPDTAILPAARSGLDGSVAGSANYAPELLVKANNIDTPLAEAILAQKTIASLSGLSKKYGQWSGNYSLVKIIRGYDVGTPREPIFPLGKDEEEKLTAEAHAAYPLMKAK
jgi:2-dehydro-3-deoxy-phosphogluconate/2-dehydro-3-deoxy-6-phosphogalactonate aldolase